MSEPEQSWTRKVTVAVSKLVGVTNISWGPKGNWRSQHAIALKDLTLPSTDEAYTVEVGETIYFDKRSYPDGPYRLFDRRRIPASNVRLTFDSESSTPRESLAPGARPTSKEYFYIGEVATAYRYDPPSVTIKKDGTVYVPAGQDDPADEYLVRDAADGNFEGTVASGSIRIRKVGETLPDHEAGPIELMCYELFPYAALHAGAMPGKKFFAGLSEKSQESGSENWAAFLGGTLSAKPKLENLKDQDFAQGDLVVLYDQFGAAIHTVIASGQNDSGGGGPLVYSLSHSPTPNPGLWSITKIASTFTSGSTVTYAKAFTPSQPE
jgi:hypothetical protein